VLPGEHRSLETPRSLLLPKHHVAALAGYRLPINGCGATPLLEWKSSAFLQLQTISSPETTRRIGTQPRSVSPEKNESPYNPICRKRHHNADRIILQARKTISRDLIVLWVPGVRATIL